MRNKSKCTIWGAMIVCLSIIAGCGGGGGGDAVTVIRAPELGISATSHDFSGVVVNNNADQTFTITNVGNNPGLAVDGISLPAGGPFSTTSDDCTGKSLGINASCTFTVRYKPENQGSHAGIMSFVSRPASPATVDLAGTGYGLNVWISGVDAVDCSEVLVRVGVTNPLGFLGSLEQGDFSLTQDGVTQSIASVEHIDPDPVSTVLALDLSSSVASAIPDIKAHSQFFIEQLRDGDEAAVFKFAATVVSYPSTLVSFVPTNAVGKADLVSNGINSTDPAAGATALYNGVLAAVTRAAAGTKSKKAVIVLSDGADTVAAASALVDVISLAKASGVPIFTIHYVDPAQASRARPDIMRQMAVETGGQDFYADTDTMQNIYGQISALLSQGYTIRYTPPACPAPAASLTVRAESIDGLYGLGTRIVDLP